MSNSPDLHCAVCQAAIPPGARFCPACAAPVSGMISHPDAMVTQVDSGPAPTPSSRPSGSSSSRGFPSLAPGAVIDGKYEIREKLGAGGFGEVYKVHHNILKRDLALKTLHPMLVHHVQVRERFFREARVLMDLSHPNIVTMRDVGDCGGMLYLVMDFCPGETLQSVLKRRGRLSAATVAGMAVPVLRALDYAHARGVVHRDLKPANLMITPGLQGKSDIRVLDFGVAKVLGDDSSGESDAAPLTGTGVAIGTLHYMSPEQASGDNPAGKGIDGRADLYSLGALMFEAVAGRRPFEGENNTQIYKRLLLDPPPTFASLKVPEELTGFEDLLRRCLAKDPRERPASARAMGDELNLLLRDRAPSTARSTRADRPAAEVPVGADHGGGVHPQRHSRASLAIGLGLGLVGLVLLLMLAFPRTPSPGTPPGNAPEPVANGPGVPGEDPIPGVPANPVPTNAPIEGRPVEDGNGPDPLPVPSNHPGGAAPVLPAGYPELPYAPTLEDPALPPALPAEWGAPGESFNRARETVLSDRRAGIEVLRTLSRSPVGGVSAHAHAALTILAVRDNDAPAVRVAMEALEARHPAAPVLEALRPATRAYWERQDRILWEKVREESQRAIPAGRLPASPTPYEGAIRPVVGLLERLSASPLADEIQAYLSDLQEKQRQAVTEAHEGAIQSAREHWQAGRVEAARAAVQVAQRFRPDSEDAAKLLEEIDAPIGSHALEPMDAEAVLDHSAPVVGLDIGPDGKELVTASSDRQIRIWNLSTRKVIRTFRAPGDKVHAVMFGRRDHSVATAGSDGWVRLWDADTGRELRKLGGHNGAVLALAVSPQAELMATAGADATIRIWKMSPPRLDQLVTFHDGPVRGVDFSPEGNILASISDDGTFKFWGLPQKLPLKSSASVPSALTCVTYLGIGRQVATGGKDGIVRLWIFPAGEVRHAIPAHEGSVTALAYHDDLHRLASAGEDGKVLLWDVRTGRAVATFRGHTGPVRSLAFFADGTRLVSGGEDRVVRVWSIGE